MTPALFEADVLHSELLQVLDRGHRINSEGWTRCVDVLRATGGVFVLMFSNGSCNCASHSLKQEHSTDALSCSPVLCHHVGRPCVQVSAGVASYCFHSDIFVLFYIFPSDLVLRSLANLG